MGREIIYPDKHMVRIPGGLIQLRDDRTKAKWTVEIKPFLISKFPVTKELFRQFKKQVPASYGENLTPIENVSWYDAVSFCNLLSRESCLKEYYLTDNPDKPEIRETDGYRLPTEAEREYACRAGNTQYRYGDIDEIAWYVENSQGRSHEVGGKEPNAWGLYDMLGNVWEWCWDLYDEKVYDSYRIFRGGGWNDPARGCGASCRRRGHPSFFIDDLGFRLAKSLPKEL